ncbi:MAG: hypothetical protein ABSC23_15140 [Bryobacteraceae bacterium]|jgi:tetratricopeptide (TPR) repeat protein
MRSALMFSVLGSGLLLLHPAFGQYMPVLVSGHVRLDDGRVPGEMVVIESVCRGVVRTEAHTDSKGGFTFTMGGGVNSLSDRTADASTRTSGLIPQKSQAIDSSRAAEWQECKLRGSLLGYRSDEIRVSTGEARDSSDVGTIVLHRLGVVEGRVVSATTLAAPKNASKAFENARKALAEGKVEDARKDLELATQVYPSYAIAWTALGGLDVRQKRSDEARIAFQKAIQADSKFLDPYLHLAVLQSDSKDWKGVAETTSKIIQLDPFDYPNIFFMNALANYANNDLEPAEKSAREAERLDVKKQYPRIFQILSLILAKRGQYAEGASQMRQYLEAAPQAPDADASRAQLAQFEALAAAAPVQAPPR